jgi:hypothetical protein
MTALLLILLGLAAAGGIGLGWDWHKKRSRPAPPRYPECISRELSDRPLRRAWDSLTADEQAELYAMPIDELLDSLKLIAWLADLGVQTVHAELVTTGDPWGQSYG